MLKIDDTDEPAAMVAAETVGAVAMAVTDCKPVVWEFILKLVVTLGGLS